MFWFGLDLLFGYCLQMVLGLQMSLGGREDCLLVVGAYPRSVSSY